ncbi:hypothetical protein CPAST_c05100 [Clostridium pasteurianum DSM 525 = ATCC 6013]|jgi:hypothetical protein|uniref:Por secretion system C-terminal sorting domain-containing protein n=1 Tax=Clostridium pasteurianum DSM 525 = ATCC 6013 TaxID=1262449 RepID=A0A0H3J6M1_CLOPA|nr:hypothetical protein [Clostridium pasteurianum]AJA46610.1 hypothetical protein CPAST_c05100 [Clostridium pasteurianum DSM 525 = ATCC 6013]AJA50598.1 hypothetical protein CLPA_c05100 [Clostridium pasteurianum DSM 525 = ATCC 6013]AOZ74023.1 hypothetical protein AQ983_02440 [Clostridium pasteurianum DSM 525 = ATCC 6013]AOZ77820.1 hypothetical protein AQ984_02440 [Clostridium pasteurianum]ELP61176.1 hypothetical protein F502_01935 [Clostridium pasteurianum DSM 525 = ATCC 6013]
MKNNRAINIAIIICILSLFITGYSPLASIKNNITTKESNKSQVFFNGKNDEKVNLTYESSVKEGILKLQLIDKDGNIVEDFQPNKNDSKQILLNRAGEYMILVVYNNFIGNYKISVKR